MSTILVIDDEEIMREILETLLTREGYQVRCASTAMEGLELIRSMPFDAAIVDVMLPGMDGVTALDEIRKLDDDLPVLMITAFASVENAIAAMKRGAYDYISKPFKNDEVLAVLRNALAQRRLVAENRALRQNLQAHANHFGDIIGKSPRMRAVFDLIIQAALRQRVAQDGEHFVVLERLADVVERAALHRRDRGLDRRVRRDHQHRQLFVDAADLLERRDAVHVGQHHVEDHGVEGPRSRKLDALARRGGGAHPVAFAREQCLENLTHDLLVVDDEDAGGVRAGHVVTVCGQLAISPARTEASGRASVNVVPLPTELSQASVPPCSWTMP